MPRLLFTASLLLAVPVLAATPISEQREANPDIHVSIENIAGSVQMRAGSGNRVEITGSLGEGSKPLVVDGDRSRLSIRVEPENEGGWGGNRMADSDLVVTVPAQARLQVETVSANVDVQGLAGSEAEIETVSGEINFSADSARVALQSVSGGIQAQGAGRDWSVATVSGRIELPKAGGELSLESVSGAIDVTFGQAERLRAETVSGHITVSGMLTAGGELALQSVSGPLDLSLAGTVDAHVRAKTFSGAIQSDFGTPERSGMGGGNSLDTKVGNGGAQIRLESFSGRVRVRKSQ